MQRLGGKHGRRVERRGGGRSRAQFAVMVLTATALNFASPVIRSVPAVAAAAAPARFVSLPPTRILDTRIGLGAPAGIVPPNGSIDLQIGGAGGVPIDATAVAFNLTATDALGAGYVTAWPSGSTRPVVSNINLQTAGATVANLVVVALPASGRVSLYTQSGASLVADVSGYWVTAAGGVSSAGRFVAQAPARILDTRDGNGATPGFRNPGDSVSFTVAGRGGVPAAGASAAVLVVTATEAGAPGFVTAWPSDLGRPLASVLNLKTAGDTVPNLVIVPIAATGMVSLYTQWGAHFVVDVVGWFTDDSASSSSSGLFVPLPPERFLDSRTRTPFGKLWPGQRNDLVVGGHGQVPASGVSAVIANLTSTDAANPGYITAWPAVTTQPVASNLNAPGGRGTVASLAFVAIGSTNAFSLFSQSGTEIIADISGYFLGSALPAEPGVPATPPPPPAPPLVARPSVPGAATFPCNAGPPMDQILRVDVNPGLKAYLDHLDQFQSFAAVSALAYTFMANSGPLPARVALDPIFDVFLSFGGPPSSPSDFMSLLNLAYHETIHDLQSGRCALTGPASGYPTPRIGFLQSAIFDDVSQRIDVIQQLSGENAFYAHDVAETYLTGDIAAQSFESQMWEINAYVLAAEWGAAINDTFGVAYLGDTAGNDDTMSAKFHQLARYLNRAQADPALWNAMRFSGLPRTVAEQWNLGVRSWQVDRNQGRSPTLYWDLAFGPDAGPIVAFTDGAAGTVAPTRPPVPSFNALSTNGESFRERLLTVEAALVPRRHD